jgi:DNA-binding response OmpR family regulator
MSKKILLVEDDVDASLMLTKMLSNAGYTVSALSEGTPLVERDFPVPDMFILDNFTPTIHGVALCRHLKLQSKTKSIPVIIISANQQLKNIAIDAGATTFLGKPFHTVQLLKLIDEIFSQKKAESTIKSHTFMSSTPLPLIV